MQQKTGCSRLTRTKGKVTVKNVVRHIINSQSCHFSVAMAQGNVLVYINQINNAVVYFADCITKRQCYSSFQNHNESFVSKLVELMNGVLNGKVVLKQLNFSVGYKCSSGYVSVVCRL